MSLYYWQMGSRCCQIFHNEKMENLGDSTSLLRPSESKGVREQRKQTDRPKPSQNSQLSAKTKFTNKNLLLK